MPRPLIEPAIVSKSDQLSALDAVANVGAPFGKGEHPDVAKRHIVPVGLEFALIRPGCPLSERSGLGETQIFYGLSREPCFAS